jgi:hypothetical protein
MELKRFPTYPLSVEFYRRCEQRLNPYAGRDSFAKWITAGSGTRVESGFIADGSVSPLAPTANGLSLQ